MDLMEKLDKKEIREFFSKNWMTHDAMWYGHIMQELGADKTNKTNKSAVKAMAGVEIKRIIKLMGKPKDTVVTTYEELKEIIPQHQIDSINERASRLEGEYETIVLSEDIRL